MNLFIKPTSGGPLFSRPVPELGGTFSLRSLDLSLDLGMIHNWVNKDYAQRFWQLSGSKSVIQNIYENILQSTFAHSFIGVLGDKPICQLDVYAVWSDELATHVEHTENDCGLHILMCPPREMQRGWSSYALRLFQEFYFSFDKAGHLYAEPDRENHPANQLAINTGFKFLKTIELSYKTANLYVMTRQDFKPI